MKMKNSWIGNPGKLSRATVFSASDWSQAMIAHVWDGPGYELLLDPVSCVDSNSNAVCKGYNDFSHMSWLGSGSGVTPIFDAQHGGQWHCIESHVSLNDKGQSNGIQELWINGELEVRRTGLDFVKSYKAYGINAIFFENYWNEGSPQLQERYFDNIVISTERIGCLNLEIISPPEGLRIVN